MDVTEATWNAMAEDYEGFTDRPGSYSEAIEVPCVEALLPSLEGARVLDLGCGTGRFSFLLAARGAREVVGLDLSERMLALAEAKRGPGKAVRFLKGSLLDPSLVEPASMDLVFSSTTLHYVGDLRGALAGIARVLKPGGRAVLSVMHPVYTSSYPLADGDDTWEPRYLDRSRRRYIQPWTRLGANPDKVVCESVHHTISDYVEALLAAGLRLTALREPGPPEAWGFAAPDRWRDTTHEPLYAVFACVKPGMPSPGDPQSD